MKFFSTWMTKWLTSVQLPWWTWDSDLYNAALGGAWSGHPLQMAILGTTSTLQPSDELWLAMPLASKVFWWPCCMRNTYIPSSENLIGCMLYKMWLSYVIPFFHFQHKLETPQAMLTTIEEISLQFCCTHSSQSASDLSYSDLRWPGHVPWSLPPVIKANPTKKMTVLTISVSKLFLGHPGGAYPTK